MTCHGEILLIVCIFATIDFRKGIEKILGFVFKSPISTEEIPDFVECYSFLDP